MLEDEHVGESVASNYFARLGYGVHSVNHSRQPRKVDRLLGRGKSKWQFGRILELQINMRL